MLHDDDPEVIPPDPTPLSVLLVDDSPDDAELCRRILSKHHSSVHLDVVSTLEEFSDRVQSSAYELVLSDYNLGIGTASDALSVLRKENRETPFILVTGTVGEEKAVECIKEGMA